MSVKKKEKDISLPFMDYTCTLMAEYMIKTMKRVKKAFRNAKKREIGGS